MVDLTDLMNRPASSIEPPKQPPAGLYVARVMKLIDRKENGQPLTSQNGNPQINITCQLEAMIEGDQAALQGVEFPITLSYYWTLTDKTLHRFTQFLIRDLGLDGNQAIKALLPMVPGRMFTAKVELRPGQKDPDQFYANITESMPLA